MKCSAIETVYVVASLAPFIQYLTSAEVYTPTYRSDCKFGTELTDFPFPVSGAVGGQVPITKTLLENALRQQREMNF